MRAGPSPVPKLPRSVARWTAGSRVAASRAANSALAPLVASVCGSVGPCSNDRVSWIVVCGALLSPHLFHMVVSGLEVFPSSVGKRRCRRGVVSASGLPVVMRGTATAVLRFCVGVSGASCGTGFCRSGDTSRERGVSAAGAPHNKDVSTKANKHLQFARLLPSGDAMAVGACEDS